jgi:hypothetical protein
MFEGSLTFLKQALNETFSESLDLLIRHQLYFQAWFIHNQAIVMWSGFFLSGNFHSISHDRWTTDEKAFWALLSIILVIFHSSLILIHLYYVIFKLKASSKACMSTAWFKMETTKLPWECKHMFAQLSSDTRYSLFVSLPGRYEGKLVTRKGGQKSLQGYNVTEVTRRGTRWQWG